MSVRSRDLDGLGDGRPEGEFGTAATDDDGPVAEVLAALDLAVEKAHPLQLGVYLVVAHALDVEGLARSHVV